MNLNEIILEILDKPSVPKFYRELQAKYLELNKSEEAKAISNLIEKKFNKKDEQKPDNTDNHSKQ